MSEAALIGWLLAALGGLFLLFVGTLAYIWRRRDSRLDNHGDRIAALEQNVAKRADVEALREAMTTQHREILGLMRGVHARIDGLVNGRVRQV